MLQTNCIAELLDMEHMNLINVKHSANMILLEVKMQRRTWECPACRTLTDNVHDYRIQRVKDRKPCFGCIISAVIDVIAAISVSMKAII